MKVRCRKCKKLKGGLNQQAFLDEHIRISRERNLTPSPLTIEEWQRGRQPGERTINFSDFTSSILEANFDVMKSAIERGIYGDQFDRDLSALDPVTGTRFNIYKRLLPTMRTIDVQRMVVKRGTRGDKAFYNLPEWKEFVKLWELIVQTAFDSIPSKPTGPKPGLAPAPAPEPEAEPERELPLPPERNQIKQRMTGNIPQHLLLRLPQASQGGPAPAPAPAPAQESYETAEYHMNQVAIQKQIEDFKNIFKQIQIGTAGFDGNIFTQINIRPDYIDLVRKAIFNTFGRETFDQITQSSKGYKKLANLARRIDRKTTEKDLEAIVKEDYPSFNFKSVPLTTQFLTTIVELYEDEIINDLTKYLNTRKGGRKCKKCGLLKRKTK